MNIAEIKAGKSKYVVVSGQDLETILSFAMTLNSGFAPKGERCFTWGQTLLAITERAVHYE